MTLYADDPDVNVVVEVTEPNNDITPAVVKVAGYGDITAEWVGDPAPTRSLRIPLYGLPPHKWIHLSLAVPGDNDVELERVIMRERINGASPVPPTTAQLLDARITALESASGQGSLVVVDGGTVDLDDTKADGYLIGYRVTATTTIEGVTFEPGSFIFERDTSVYGGWTYRTVAAGAGVVTPPDTTAPTAPTLSVDNSASTQLVATFSGGTDAVGVTQYRTRIDGGAWSIGSSPRTFAGLQASMSYTIDAQAGDAAGNWSSSTSWTGSTSAPSAAITDTFTAADGTSLTGRSTDTGGKTWATLAAPAVVAYGTVVSTSIAGNAVRAAGTGGQRANQISADQINVRVSVDFTIASAHLDNGFRIAVASVDGSNSLFGGYYPTEGFKIWKRVAGALSQVGATYGGAAPTSGTLSLEYDGSTVALKLEGATIVTGTAAGHAGTLVAIGHGKGTVAGGVTLDNFKVWNL